MSESAVVRRAREQFERDHSNLEMQILHDEGLYRHLRFRRPETRMYSYDLVTWPGHLAFTGDMDGGHVFARVEDMIDFFAAERESIDFRYWAEKLVAHKTPVKVFSPERLKHWVADAIRHLAEKTSIGGSVERARAELNLAWEEHVEFRELTTEHAAQDALSSFSHDGYGFGDEAWERDLLDWDHHFLLCCFAIRAGCNRYRASKPAAAGVPV